jgi:membrane fusion protein, multidrug efflux system
MKPHSQSPARSLSHSLSRPAIIALALAATAALVGGVAWYQSGRKLSQSFAAGASTGASSAPTSASASPSAGARSASAGGASGVKAIAVDGIIARSAVLSNEAISSGTLLASEATDVKSDITGRIVGIHFNEGQNVNKGQLLVKLYDADLQAQLLRAQTQRNLFEKNLERNQALAKLQSISQQEIDLTEAQLAAARADIEVVKANLAKTEIRAPFAGNVGLRNVSVGAVLTAAQTITTIQQTAQLKMDFTLPEKYSKRVRVGDVVRFTTDGSARLSVRSQDRSQGRSQDRSQDTLQASIYALDAGIEPITRTIRLRARFDNRRGMLSAGAFATVRVALEQQRGILIPTQAVIPQTRGKSVILARGGKAVLQPIETGLRTADRIEVTSGLQEGDTVVTKGVMFVKPAMQLQFNHVE